MGGALLYLAPVTILTSSRDLPPQVEALYGSLREGRAVLSSGHQLSWRTRPGLGPWPGFLGEIRLEGGRTEIAGRLRLHWRRLGVEGLSGRAGPGLAALVPGAWSCERAADLSGVTLLWQGGAPRAGGGLDLPAGRCTKGGSEIALPDQRLDFGTGDKSARARLRAGELGEIASLEVTAARRAHLRISPEAGRVYPVLPRGAPIALDYDF
ncbi:hypothetical protein LR948_18720 [Roseivivax sp. GX 12232]|uniref:hypothetical protein n=1 Tax=Roseivivax sp. GX 12232 TaxID=2900547 RepID=UPI001E529364|nr:hypothetical protein [Roseivivax sp. GX 12232]MCE0507390.1 hypothetical protein [Roseivivax sp. GX 12232]